MNLPMPPTTPPTVVAAAPPLSPGAGPVELAALRQETEQQRQRAAAAERQNTELVHRQVALEQQCGRLTAQVAALEKAVTERQQLQTERVQLENRMVETQQWESLGTLAGGIAHDFNNLLTAIMGHSELARLDANGSVRLEQSLDEITRASQQAADLCRQMLDFAGRGRPRMSLVYPNVVVHESLALARPSAGRLCVIEERLAADLPHVLGDATQLAQALVYVLLNALEAVGDHAGTVTMSSWSERLELAELRALHGAPDLPAGEYVCLEVRDTGCGMTGEVRARIFEPFYSTKFLGRGMGLPATIGIVRAHGGGLSVTSQLGVGTTVRLYFPILPVVTVPVVAPTPPEPKPVDDWHGQGLLLVADSAPGVLQVTALACATLGFETVTASDGAEALQLFQTHRAQLVGVLIAYRLTRGDVVHLAGQMRAARPQLPIVVVSGLMNPAAADKLRADLPGVTFLAKPFGLEKLRDCLRQTVRPLPAAARSSGPAK